jgi:hypothetical protein
MSNHDADPHVDLSPDEIQWEQERASSLRAFEVTLQNGSVHRVLAHSWYVDDIGDALFTTIQPSGRSLIQAAFSARIGWYVKEVTPPAAAWHIDQITRRHSIRARLAKMGPVSVRTH